MTRSQERQLIERVVAGDKDSAVQLVRQHQDSLQAYLLRLSGRPDVAEDIAQEAFVRVFMHLDRFDPRFRFSTWLFTIAKRLYVNACQKHKPLYDSDVVGASRGGEREPWNGPMDAEVRANARHALGEALNGLSEEQREIVILFHQLSWPIAPIAQHMAMPEGTIKSHLHRSRKKMRRLLEADDRHRADVAEVWS